MLCDICQRSTNYSTQRFQIEFFLDGLNYDNVCLLCSQFVQRYYGDNSSGGILTGYLTDEEFILNMGWGKEEVANSLKCIRKLAGNPVASPQPIFASLVFDQVKFLDFKQSLPSSHDHGVHSSQELDLLRSN